VPDRRDRLAATTLALVDIPSESRDEAAAAAWVEQELAAAPLRLAYREGSALVYETEPAGRPLVVLAGHLDTVPAQGNRPGWIEDGCVVGLGASDMKGGVAVMVEIGRWLAVERPDLTVDLALLFFPREELPLEESALPGVFAGHEAITRAELAVMLEPTDNTIQAGCLGNLNARLVVRGESAHSARPWLGRNAIEKAIAALAPLLPVPAREVDVSGLRFVEVVSPTGVEGGIAANVVPDSAALDLNFRYAPDRAPDDAERRIHELFDPVGEVTVTSNSPAARVVVDATLVQSLREAGGFAVEPKQAWTPVAEFDAAGIPAVNLGPGATRYAHRADERVEIDELVRTFEALTRFLRGSV